MIVHFKKAFLKDLKRLNDRRLKEAIHGCILNVEEAESLGQVKNLKKLSGFESHFRIRIGNYRIGLKVEDDVVHFVVFDHRKDIYKGFP
jgi:mRNA interferase RelE/StbE